MASSDASVFEVCYIEDNPADVRLMSEAIAQINLPFRLHPFSTLAEAVRALVEEKNLSVDLILLDGGLSLDENGELLRRLRAGFDESVPLIVFSGSPPPEPITSHLWDRWVQKPVGFGSYVATVHEILLSAATRREQ